MMKKSFVVGCVIVAAVLIFACSSQKALWGNAKEGFILSYRLAPGESWSYTSSGEEKTSLVIMGADQGSTTTLNNVYTIQAEKVDDTGLLCRVTIDDFSRLSKGPMGEMSDDVSNVLGKDFALAVSPLGVETDYSGIDEITLNMGPQNGGEQSVLNFYRDLLPDLPDKPVKFGDSWTVNGEFSSLAGNMDLTVTTETTHTVEGLETMDGLECLKIATAFTGAITGTGEQEGNDLDFSATIAGSGVWYFDYKKGALVKSASTSKIEDGTIDVSGSYAFSIPLKQETTSTAQLVKK